MRKLLSCFIEGRSDVPCLCLRPILLSKVSWITKGNMWLSMFFSNPSPSWNPTKFCTHIKIHMLCQAEICCVSNETFQCSDTWYFRGGIAPSAFRSAASQNGLLIWIVLVFIFLACLKLKMVTPFLTTFPFTSPELQLLRLIGRKEILEK